MKRKRHAKIIKDPVQVHNKLGHYDETVWDVPMDESHSPSRRSPSRSPEEIGGVDLVGNLQTSSPFVSNNGFHNPME